MTRCTSMTPASEALRPRRIDQAASRCLAMTVAIGLALSMPMARAADCPPTPWPLWEAFAKRFVQADGRVVNFDSKQQESISEGQAYALFFALVANDRNLFERLLSWTRDNLAGGDLTDKLPAWQWGRTSQGKWDVLDANSAADADLWLAYTLIEAGHLWNHAQYRALGRSIEAQIVRRETVRIPGLGWMVLPGERGFRLEGGVWRLNPSYLPLPVLRRLALENPTGPWHEITAASVKLLKATGSAQVAPDWVAWREGTGFIVDPEKGDTGSFDAIRVYLWAGMTNASDPLRKPILDALAGMQRAVVERLTPPEKFHPLASRMEGTGPVGFSAALIPFLAARRQPQLAARQERRVIALLGAVPAPESLRYYDTALALFGTGWAQHRFRFDRQGRLIPQWRQSCDSGKNMSSQR